MKTSEANATVPVGEDAQLVNNRWGEYKLTEGETYEQTIAVDEPILNGAPHWRWECNTAQPGVKGFPAILYGRNPHGGLDTVNDPEVMPWPLDRLQASDLDLDYSLKVVNPTGLYNVMIDLWITSGPEATKEQITHEIMIVLGGAQWTPGKHQSYNAIIGGFDWAYYKYKHLRALHECIVLEYADIPMAGKPRLSGILPIHEVLDWCRRWAGLRGGYLACVLLGTEIINGGGLVVVERYEMMWG